MERYSDIDRDSGVVGYETGAYFIRVRFNDGSVYLYTYNSAGRHHIESMKRLACQGDGLNACINDYARKSYERKEQ